MNVHDARIERAIIQINNAVASRTRAIDKIEQKRRAALAACIPLWLESLPEPERAKVFAGLEAYASTAHRRILQAHPLRPETTDDLLSAAAVRAAPAVDVEAPAPVMKEPGAD